MNDFIKRLAKLYALILLILASLLLLAPFAAHDIKFEDPSDYLYLIVIAIMFFAGYSLYTNSGRETMKFDTLTLLLLVITQISLILFGYIGISDWNELPIYFPLIFLVIFATNLFMIYHHYNFYRHQHKNKNK